MRAALNSLAVVAPDWLRAHSHAEWVERYGPRSEDSRSPDGGKPSVWLLPRRSDNREENCLMPHLIQRLLSGSALFRRLRSYDKCGCKITNELMMWNARRSSENIPPPSRYIGSPYDEDAHYSKKRSTTWVGYKVHLTESCEAHLPLLITHVETTSAPVSDDAMTATIHAELDRKALLPTEHIVDTGYVDAKLLVESQRDYQIDLVGPTRRNHQWQGRRAKRLRC
jgi:transposase